LKLPGFLLTAALLIGCNKPAALLGPREAVQKYESDYRAAVELHQKLIREGRDVDALRFELGMLYFGKAEFKRALEEFKGSNNVHAPKMIAIAYYNLGDYKASIIALKNSLNEFPDTKYREELMFMLLESKYMLAIGSVFDKRQERLSSALDEYFTFIDEFPESKHIKEAEKFYKTTSQMLNYKEGETTIN